jgi:N-dimethylarginine dimethylaminohydrolase
MLETPPAASLPVLGECQQRPHAIIVHDPVAAGAFGVFDSLADGGRIESDLLFRAKPQPGVYAAHHALLVRTIAAHVPNVIYLHSLIGGEPIFESAAANPNQVFTRDSLITLPWAPDTFFCARLRPQQRRHESDLMKKAVERLGLCEALRLPVDIFLEGGDVIPFAYEGQRCLFIGYGPRSSPEAIDFLQQALLPHYADVLIALRLAAWRMNLDGGFVPAANDVVIADTSSILAAELIHSHTRTTIDLWQTLADLGMRVIDTTPEESVYAQSCNYLCLGDRNVVGYDLCPRVTALLEQSGIRVHSVLGAELIKGRGGPRCMTRPIYLPPAASRGPGRTHRRS